MGCACLSNCAMALLLASHLWNICTALYCTCCCLEVLGKCCHAFKLVICCVGSSSWVSTKARKRKSTQQQQRHASLAPPPLTWWSTTQYFAHQEEITGILQTYLPLLGGRAFSRVNTFSSVFLPPFTYEQQARSMRLRHVFFSKKTCTPPGFL